jgi:DNA-directed RNA polymerase specialized sigma24 family protein
MPALSDTQRELLLAELGGLRGFCYSLTGNHADADDLLKITIERVLKKGMPTDAHAAKWAYRV